MTAFNDADDFFDVCCRGPPSAEIAVSSLEGRICAGAIVNNDEHWAYPGVTQQETPDVP